MRSYNFARRSASSHTGVSCPPFSTDSCSSARSMPAQKTGPAPVRMTDRTAASPAARANASASASIRPRLRALRRSARFIVTQAAPLASTSYCTRLSLIALLARHGTQHLDEVRQGSESHLEQRQGERLALRVRPQRAAGPAAEHVVEHE